MDLARHTSTELKQVVTPLINEMEKLDAAALLSLNPTKSGRGAALDPRRGLTVPPIHNRILPTYKNNGDNIVRYLHASEVPHKYSVGIFVFPPNTEIPLHDHPDMVVISRVLYGELRVRSYDVIPEEDDGKDRNKHKKNCNDRSMAGPPSALRASFNKLKEFVSRLSYTAEDEPEPEVDSVLHVKPNLNAMNVQPPPPDDKDAMATISAPNVTCLFPHEGNCHSFVAGPNGACVIDVLLPPYCNEDDRDCTFYEASQDEEPSSLTLTAINQPDDFHCLGGSYGRFGACKEYGGEEEPQDDKKMSICNLS